LRAGLEGSQYMESVWEVESMADREKTMPQFTAFSRTSGMAP